MVKSEITLAAKGIVRDAEDNTISIFSLLEGISAEGFPLFMQTIYFFTYLKKSEDDADRQDSVLTVTLNRKELLTHQKTLDFQGKQTNRLIVNINGLVIPGPGDLTFSLKIGNRTISKYSFEVSEINPPSIIASGDGD